MQRKREASSLSSDSDSFYWHTHRRITSARTIDYPVVQKIVLLETPILADIPIDNFEDLLEDMDRLYSRRSTWQLHLLSSQLSTIRNTQQEKESLLQCQEYRDIVRVIEDV
ncbi:hypothetical protein MAR_012008, partial [Mya arenaria]